jgi:Leucine-rich repeat (LRR) protein
LEDVELSGNDLLTDITPLSGLTKLKRLKIDKCPNIKSLGPLSSLANVTYLALTHNNNYDYRALASLRQLETLILIKDADEIDLRHIGQLDSLKTLYIINWHNSMAGRITNINELQNLVNLETLDISGIDNLDLSWASGLHNLSELTLRSCTIADISPLAQLPNLVEVDVASSGIKDIAPLAYSNSVKYLRVFAHDVDGGIDDSIRSLFSRKNIELDTFYDDR